MPGQDPPDPELPSAMVTTLKTMSYDSANKAFKSGATLYWFFVEHVGTDVTKAGWFHDTDSGGAYSPKFFIPQLTYDVIKNGTYSSGRMIYLGDTYAIRMFRESSTSQIAKAIKL
jgi:hypothetical protein